jgi:photosystem II stability/assembly factor-like uncharacterized protein
MRRMKRIACIRFILLIFFGTLFFIGRAVCQGETAPHWHVKSLPFRVFNITSNGSTLWTCGSDETLAVSADSGEHWQLKHQKTGGAVLLNVGFANEKFGYAAGTGGQFLTTEDGGDTWSSHSAGEGTISQVSFSDARHGLIRTYASLLFTSDGGATWALVPAAQNSEEIKEFPYSFSLVALDSEHMAVMMKHGPGQYEDQGLFLTENSGRSWKFSTIPNVTLYSFLRAQGKYWVVGTEVIHKDEPGGGHAVPVALYSSDADKWERSNNDLSACQPEMCTLCTSAGCLSANGTITGFFSERTSYRAFTPNPALTAKWAADGSAICFAGKTLQCADVNLAVKPSIGDIQLPTALAPKSAWQMCP